MSLSYFCPNCGGKNIYQFQKPKFCSYCGTQLTTTANAPFSQNATAKETKVSVKNPFQVTVTHDSAGQSIRPMSEPSNNEDFSEDNFSESYSSMRGLDVEITKGQFDDSVKLDDLINADPIRPIEASAKTPKKRGRKKIQKSLPESFINEAKMTGRGSQNEMPNFEE